MRWIDLTVPVTPALTTRAGENEPKAKFGHLGTHFDVMDRTFPLAFLERNAVVFDVRGVYPRDIEARDIALDLVQPDQFVMFYTGFIEQHAYGAAAYFSNHPQLADALIDQLLARRISLIGVDCAGIRCGVEHTPKDQYCADHGVFVVENLCNLGELLQVAAGKPFSAYTFPIHYLGLTGLPCRVVALL